MRLIDADVLKYALGCSDEAMRFDAMIDEMPTINQSPVWTPCSDGMPTNSGVYGVTWKNLETDRDFASFGTFDARMQRWDDQNERYVITAWMPKPEPYRAADTTGKVKEEAE